MGYTTGHTDRDLINPTSGHNISVDSLEYNSSWPALLEVVDKIDTMTNQFVIRDCSATIYATDTVEFDVDFCDSRLDACYQVIVKFVTWLFF